MSPKFALISFLGVIVCPSTASRGLGLMSAKHNVNVNVDQNAGAYKAENIARPQLYKIDANQDAVVDVTVNDGAHANIVIKANRATARRGAPIVVAVPVSASAKSNSKVDSTDVETAEKLLLFSRDELAKQSPTEVVRSLLKWHDNPSTGIYGLSSDNRPRAVHISNGNSFQSNKEIE